MKVKVFCQGELETNSVVLEKDGKCIVVDLPYRADKVAKYVVERQLKVLAVLLTHGHFDHCGGVTQFLQRCNCQDVPVYVHGNDWDLSRHCEQWLADYYGKIPWKMCDNCFPTREIYPGKLQIGDFCFEVIETPGHTAGSVSFVIDGVVLCGDALFKGSVGRTDFKESVPQEMANSLKKLCALPDKTKIIPGHGETTTVETEKATNPHVLALKL